MSVAANVISSSLADTDGSALPAFVFETVAAFTCRPWPMETHTGVVSRWLIIAL